MPHIPGERLPPDQDSRSLSLLRARAERLLAQCARLCRVESTRPERIVLDLIDNPESRQVVIVVRAGHDCCVETTPRWVEESSDEQIMAVFAHEFGHLLNGDLDPPPPTRAHATTLGLSASLLGVCIVGFLQTQGALPPSLGVAWWGVIALPFAVLFACLAHARHAYRRGEYQADAFAARHGFGQALLVDLEKDWRLLGGFQRLCSHGPFASHPPYGRRRRAIIGRGDGVCP